MEGKRGSTEERRDEGGEEEEREKRRGVRGKYKIKDQAVRGRTR